MFSGFKNIAELLDHFKEKQTCLSYLEQQRWADGKITCLHCGGDKVYRTKIGFRCATNGCCKKFSVLVGSIYENTKIPLRLWFGAIYLATSHKKGISSMQLATDLGICQKSAWHMMHRIREAMFDADEEIQLKGTVQADESYFGGKNKNRHIDKQYENSQGRSTNGKTPVVGLLEVGGRVRTFVVSNTDAGTLNPLIEQHVNNESILVTDAYPSYNDVGLKLQHIVVKHKEGSYITEKDGSKFHTQNIENYWSVFKRGYIGVYHYMSEKHLHRYCKEFTFRYNNRNLTPKERFDLTVKQSSSKRITFKKLTEKTLVERPKVRKMKTTEQLIQLVNTSVEVPYSDWTIGMSPNKTISKKYSDNGFVFKPYNRKAILDTHALFAELGMQTTGEFFDEPVWLFVHRNNL